MGLSIGEITAFLAVDDKGFDKGLVAGESRFRAAGTAMSKASDTMAGRVGARMTSVGKTMTMCLTLPLVAAGTIAVKMAADFETSMNQVQAASGASAREMKSLSAYAMKMGADTMFSAGEAAQAMLELSKGGMTAAQVKAGGLKAALDLAAAGDLELAQAAEVTIQAMGMFGIKAKDAASVADALAGGANASTASVEDLAQAFAQVGPGAKTAGLSLQQTVGVLAEFADKGIKGSDAGTSLKTMLSRLIPATSKAAKAMDAYGLSFVDSKGNIDDITVVAQKLQDRLGGLSQAQRMAALETIFGSDATRAATILMEGGASSLRKYIKAANDKTAADKMAEARTKGLSGAIEALKGSFETIAISVMQVLIPPLTKVAKWVTSLANHFTALSDTQKEWLLGIAGAAAAIGPTLIIFGKLATAISAVRAAMIGLGIIKTASTITAIGASASQAVIGVTQMVRQGGYLVPVLGQVAAGSTAVATTSTAAATATTALAVSMSTLLGAAAAATGIVLMYKYGQSASDALARSLSGMTQAEVEAEETMKASRFGGKAKEEFDRARSSANSATKAITNFSDAVAAAIEKVRSPIQIKGDIKDVETKIAKVKARIAELKTQPQTAEVLVKIDKAQARLAELKGKLSDIHKQRDPVLIQAKIDTAKANVKAMESLLKKLNKQKTSPKIEAEKKTLETAITSAKSHLRTLANQKTEAKITAKDYATEKAKLIRANLVSLFAKEISQTVTIGIGGTISKQAKGGDYLVSKPTLFMAGEAGAERATFTPLKRAATASVAQSGSGDVIVEITTGDIYAGSESEAAESIDYITHEVTKRLVPAIRATQRTAAG